MQTLYIFYIPALIFFIRFLMQYTGCDYYHPACKFIVMITSPFLKLIPTRSNGRNQNTNIPALILSFISLEVFGFIGFFLMFRVTNISPSDIIFVFGFHLILFANMLVTVTIYLLIIGAILSWIPNEKLMYWTNIIFRLVSPLTNPLDRIIPPIGVISISFLVLLLILNLFQYLVIPFILNFWSNLWFQ